jgi:hypothetical protein
MIEIQLPMLEGNEVGVHDALAATINDRKSALLFRRGDKDLRLVHFESLEKAAADGMTRLRDVPSEPVPRITGDNDLSKTKSGFGFLREQDEKGVLAYLSEQMALTFGSPSTGFRCDRANKPANTPDGQWYHYYPPNRRDLKNPKRCRVCGAPLP